MTAFDSSSSGFCTNHCSVVREGCFDLQDSFSGPLPKFISEPGRFSACGFTAAVAPVLVQSDLCKPLPSQEDRGEKGLLQKLKLSFAVACRVAKARDDWGRNTRAFRILVLTSPACGQTALHDSFIFPPCVFLTSRQSARKSAAGSGCGGALRGLKRRQTQDSFCCQRRGTALPELSAVHSRSRTRTMR
jgi:hypothetical protein